LNRKSSLEVPSLCGSASDSVNCKGYANGWGAYPFIKTFILHSNLQSIVNLAAQ
jgi:hypothetical protein